MASSAMAMAITTLLTFFGYYIFVTLGLKSLIFSISALFGLLLIILGFAKIFRG